MKDLRGLVFSEIQNEISKLSLKKYIAGQVVDWIIKGEDSIDNFTNISKNDRKILKDHFYIQNVSIVKKLTSSVDSTVKYLFAFDDGVCVESVVMEYHHGRTICVSTQAGCRMGCKFCATGQNGYIRNLTPGEIMSQIYVAQSDLHCKIGNVVLMGMGEPLDNFDNVVKFVNVLTDSEGYNLGSRHITLSTCGVADKIIPFFEYNGQITLSVSLHSAENKIRSELMPINKKFDIEYLMNVCKEYNRIYKKRITFEYSMINGLNDSIKDAEKLSELIKDLSCHVNLIPVNQIDESGYRGSNLETINMFKNTLLKNNINTTVRRTLGSDIKASCGQLKDRRV